MSATLVQADADAATVFDPDSWTAGAPYDALERLRAGAPVHPIALPDLPRIWLLTRHDDVIRVSRDDATFSSSTGNTFIEVPAGGKPAALNAGVAASRGSIVVFADARQRFSRSAVAELVANFEDAAVGGVTGELVLDCEHEFAPGVAELCLDGPAPLLADADGTYPLPEPGKKRRREF